jgi:hypothetical protein
LGALLLGHRKRHQEQDRQPAQQDSRKANHYHFNSSSTKLFNP